jgi:hypothetical protein
MDSFSCRSAVVLYANMGIPMVCESLPTMLLALLPIALVEACVLRLLLGTDFRRAWRGALPANFWSTLLGIPAAWLVLVGIQFAIGGSRAWGMDTPQQRLDAVTLQAAWLIPYEGQLSWMIPAASLVLLTPFWLASVIVEYRYLRRDWGKSYRPTKLLVAVVVANVLSYALLDGYYGARLYFATAPAPNIDHTQPFWLEFGRGSGWHGLETIKIDQTGRVVLHRIKSKQPDNATFNSCEVATLRLSPEALAEVHKAVESNGLMELDEAYHQHVVDGAQWVLWIRHGELEKAVYFNNSFPPAIKAFAQQLDAILGRAGLDKVAWQPVPQWQSRQHERELWRSIER